MQPREIEGNAEVRALLAESNEIIGASFAITSVETYERVADELKRIKDAQAKLEKLRKSFTQPLDQAKRVVMDWFRGPEQRLKDAEQARKDAMIAYDREQERIAAEAQRKLDEQAARERAKLEEQARKAAASGRAARAEELTERASMVVAPVVQTERPTVSGIATRENWHAEIVDFGALVRAVAEGEAPRACLKPDEVFLNKQARALKSELDYPGVRAVSERGLAARRR